MKNFYTCILFLFSIFLVSCNENPKLMLGGSGWDKVVILDKNSGKVEWEFQLEKGWECNSVNFTPAGNALIAFRRGAMEVDMDKNVLWKIDAPQGCELHSTGILPDGNYLLGMTGHPAVIMEVDPKGQILSRTEFETGIPSPHAQFRQISKNRAGNYMVPLLVRSVLREIDREGKTLKEMKVEAKPFAVMEDGNGTYWIGGGDAHTLSRVDFNGNRTEKIYRQTDIKGTSLFFVAGIHDSGKNTMYVCNWKGHSRRSKTLDSPSLFEVDSEGNIVWKLNDEGLGKISCIDVKGVD